MSKNLTRKGLALGAIVALGASLFAGAPAQANTSGVLLAPATGTTNGMISGEAFTLQATIGSLIPSSSYGQLKFEVTNASGLTVTTVLTQTGSNADTDLSSSTLTTAQVVRSTTANVTGGANTTLAVSTAAADAGTVSVNAWLDADGDHAIDAGEIASGPQVITFVKPADVTWTTTLAQPFVGDTKQTVVVKSDKNINLDQVKAKVQVAFATLSGSTYTALTGTTMPSNGTFTVGETTTFVSADNSLKAELTNTALASTTYVAQAVWTTGTAELGSESAKAVAAATITKLTTPSITAGDDLSQSTNTITARNGITSFTATSQAYLSYSSSTVNTKAAAGQTVKVTITEGSATGNTDAATFVAGGKTLKDTTSAADSIEFTVTTDATGLVSIPVTVSGTVAGTDSITILVAAQSASAVASTLTTTVNFADATVANGALVDANQIGSGAIYKKVAGSTTTLKFAAKDSFGKGLGSTYRVLLTESGSSPSVIKDAVFSNGVATFSITDSTTVAEVYSAQLQSYSSSTLTWSNGNFTPAVSVTPVIGASEAVGSVATLAGSVTSALVLNLNDLKAVDTRSGGSAPTVVSSGNIATLSGTVLDANSIPTYGEVTLSATGAMFETNGVYALGSITVQTNNSGAFGGVKIYSNTAGKTTVTATSNGKTKTLDLTFDAAAVTTGSVYTLDAPLRVAPGATLTVTPVITDKYGNKVAQTANFTFAYSGPGLPINTNATTTANTAFRVLLGAGDTGAATITWTVDKNNDNDTTDSGEIVTATVVIGATPATVATANVAGSTKRFFVSVDGNTSARNVVVKVAGKTFKTLKGSSAKKSYAVAAPKGTHKVTVFVGGKLIATKTISVK
jgi:trimeric autotransporter adhesin